MKKVYFLVALAMASMTSAVAQSSVEQDTDFDTYFGYGTYFNTDGINIVGCTVTMKAFSLNLLGLPQSSLLTSEWCPVTLSNGGKVKFFDCPQYASLSEEAFAEIDAALVTDYDWSLVEEHYSTQISVDWVIEGKGNAIYLDSNCDFGGTITGGSADDPAEVTIYCSNNSKINTRFLSDYNEANPSFVGTVIFKSLDGYNCDTIKVGSGYLPGYDGTNSVYVHHSTYAGTDLVFDISQMNAPVVHFDYNNALIPVVNGKGTIYTGYYPEVMGYNGTTWPSMTAWICDADIVTVDESTHSFEHYGGSIVYNGNVDVKCTYYYVRSDADIYFNSSKPNLSGSVNGVSKREGGVCGGTGYLDCGYSPNNHRFNKLSPGYPYNTVNNTFTVKDVWMSGANNGLHVDFDNEGHSDILNVAGTYHMFAGQSQITLGLPEQFSPKAGKYQVINGAIDAGWSTYVDTIGYQVWDNNGCMYVIRSVKGGETITRDGAEVTAAPGDSIGTASFGELAPKYGATCMDGNRPYYEIARWGAGSYTNGESVDGDYMNTESPSLYKANDAQRGTAFSDSATWDAEWQKFLEDHPVSKAWENVPSTDPSVIPGTLTDSIFLTYSMYHDSEGNETGAHAWSTKNGSGYLVGSYPYAAPITYSYYYYSNNTLRLYGTQTANYIVGEGDTIKVSFPQQNYPISITENRDSVVSEVKDIWNYTYNEEGAKTDSVAAKDTVWSFNTVEVGKRWYTAWSAKVPQANGDSVAYRFNFKDYISKGVVAIETATFKANSAEVVYETPAEDNKEEIINEGDVLSIGTLAKEVSSVKERTIFNLAGVRTNKTTTGVNIVRTVYSDGRVVTKRYIVR